MATLQKNTLRERKGDAAVISSCFPNDARSSSSPSGSWYHIYSHMYVAILGVQIILPVRTLVSSSAGIWNTRTLTAYEKTSS